VCDLWSYDFATATERRLAGVSRSDANEVHPVIWGDRVVFKRATRRGVGVHAGSIARGSPRRLRRMGDASTVLDLKGRRIAYAQTIEDSQYPHMEVLYLRDILSGYRRRISSVSSGEMSYATFVGAAFEGKYLYVAKARRGASGDRFMRFPLPSGKPREIGAPGGMVSTTFTQGRAFYLQSTGEEEGDCDPEGGLCEAKLTDPLSGWR
jgi:hypothetical protein